MKFSCLKKIRANNFFRKNESIVNRSVFTSTSCFHVSSKVSFVDSRGFADDRFNDDIFTFYSKFANLTVETVPYIA